MATSSVAQVRDIDLARGKIATQSSFSNWSHRRDADADASLVVDGQGDGREYSNHTAAEPRAWWQVDLGDAYMVTRIAIANRTSHPERLGTITVLGSDDGQTWTTLARHAADGATSFDIPVNEDLPIRFVRVRKEQYGFLHLRSVAVHGRAPSDAERRRGDTLAEHRRAELADSRERFAAGRRGRSIWAGSFEVFADEDRYSSGVIAFLQNGVYEKQERAAMPFAARPGDRVLEIGTAVGVVTMTAASIVGPENVITFEANPHILADARRNFEVNGLGAIRSTNAVLCARSRIGALGETMSFGVSREFVCSRLGASSTDPDIIEMLRIPTMCLEDVIEETEANVLVCDIEGGEVDLLTNADLSRIDTVLLETHYWAAGKPAVSRLMRKLAADGFDVDLDHSEGHVTLLKKHLV